MLPGPLAPIDSNKTRALTTIYAPRKLKTRKNKTAQTRMLENDIPIKPSLSPFHPLPAIGQKSEKTKVILLDLDKPLKFHEVLQPLTPLRIHGLRRTSLENLEKPQQLLRENTYDVITPTYLNAPRIERKDCLRKTQQIAKQAPKMSPKTRFKNAALQVAKLTSMRENGKLLCLRERETFTLCKNEEDSCRLQRLPKRPPEKLNKLSEIFQSLELQGRQRERINKENSWF